MLEVQNDSGKRELKINTHTVIFIIIIIIVIIIYA
jgi:hypothetical protein